MDKSKGGGCVSQWAILVFTVSVKQEWSYQLLCSEHCNPVQYRRQQNEVCVVTNVPERNVQWVGLHERKKQREGEGGRNYRWHIGGKKQNGATSACRVHRICQCVKLYVPPTWRRRPFGDLSVGNCCGMTTIMMMIAMIMIILSREQLYQQDRKWGGHDSNDTLPSLCFPF